MLGLDWQQQMDTEPWRSYHGSMMTSKQVWKVLQARMEGGFDTLMPEEQEAVAIWALVCETMNGTLYQFFWNSSGDLALIARTGLQRLEQPITLAALNSALDYFGPAYPPERYKRQEVLEDIEAQYGEEVFREASNLIQDYPEEVDEIALLRLGELYVQRGMWTEETPVT